MIYRDNLFLNARFQEAVQAAHDQDWQTFEKYSFYDAKQNGEGLFPMKIFTAPQHTRFVLPPFHPTKFFACLAGRYFSFGKLHLEFFISRLNEILRHDLTLSVGEPDNAAAKQGQELRSV